MALRQEEAISRWVRDVCSTGLLRRSYRSSGTRLDEEGRLVYQRAGGERSRAWGPVQLATWLPDARTFLLNGDGFTDFHATNWQTHLRTLVQQSIRDEGRGWNQVPIPPGVQQMVVPYVALRAAGIEFHSIKPIEVSLDRNEEVRHEVPAPPEDLTKYKINASDPTLANNMHRRQRVITIKGLRYAVEERNAITWEHVESGTVRRHQPYGADLTEWKQIDSWTSGQKSVWMSGRRIEAGWHDLMSDTDEDDIEHWFWTENIHHLGASVFYGRDDSGRKRFISAFDQDEPMQMYYLAQLPAKGRIRTYDEAVAALAPPIVHEARRNGRRVHRQGDVFAIETELTDEELYAKARTRVRRDVALWTHSRGTIQMPALEPLDTKERTECPCCGVTVWSGWGPKARRALMIYGTGHTADEVVVIAGGAVYIRGAMHHDPNLETAGRHREHADLALGDGKKWFLAVRNTVPRRNGSSDSNREEDAA